MDSPIAQDSAGQSPGQLSDFSLLQWSGENMAANCPGSPWLARELKRFSQNDLYDVLPSSVQERSPPEDVTRQAEREIKEQDSAINKHLDKKAGIEEKLRFWQPDSAVSNSSVDSDGYVGDAFQSGLGIEKRIRGLKEASKQQDVAIQQHIIRKASLERELKAWQPKLDYESGQPGKRLVFEAEGEEAVGEEAEIEDADGEDTFESMPIGHRPKEKRAQNDVKSDGKPLMLPKLGGGIPAEAPSRPRYCYTTARSYKSSSSGSGIPAKAPSDRRYCYTTARRYESSLSNYKETVIRSPFTKSIGEQDTQLPSRDGKTHHSFKASMDEMFERFAHVDIGRQSACQSRIRRAGYVEVSHKVLSRRTTFHLN